jgi:hypothetical protein
MLRLIKAAARPAANTLQKKFPHKQHARAQG